jgi:hypothetical protein
MIAETAHAVTIKGHGPSLARLPYGTPFLRLDGTLTGTTASAIRRVHQTRLTLRLRVDAPVVLELWQRAISRWVITTYKGRDIQHRLPRILSADLRLIVHGNAHGLVDLVRE